MGGALRMTGTQTRIKNFGIPNMLSILRIILIPVFVAVFFSSIRDPKTASLAVNQGRLVAAGILVFSGITDIVDGIIARKFNMITELGRVLDPLADKLTQATVCICLVILSVNEKMIAPVFLLAIFIVKEGVMIGAGANIIRKHKEMISAKWFGKLSTVVFYIVMISIIAFPGIPPTTIYILIAISLAFMIFSFIMYIPIFLKLASDKSRNDEPVNN
jgi:cardiolipin synthase